MNKAYIIKDFGNLVEFTFEKETAQMYLGVKKTRDIVGRCNYLPKRLPIQTCSFDVYALLEQLREYYKVKINRLKSELGRVETAFQNELVLIERYRREARQQEHTQRLTVEKPALLTLIEKERQRQRQHDEAKSSDGS